MVGGRIYAGSSEELEDARYASFQQSFESAKNKLYKHPYNALEYYKAFLNLHARSCDQNEQPEILTDLFSFLAGYTMNHDVTLPRIMSFRQSYSYIKKLSAFDAVDAEMKSYLLLDRIKENLEPEMVKIENGAFSEMHPSDIAPQVTDMVSTYCSDEERAYWVDIFVKTIQIEMKDLHSILIRMDTEEGANETDCNEIENAMLDIFPLIEGAVQLGQYGLEDTLKTLQNLVKHSQNASDKECMEDVIDTYIVSVAKSFQALQSMAVDFEYTTERFALVGAMYYALQEFEDALSKEQKAEVIKITDFFDSVPSAE